MEQSKLTVNPCLTKVKPYVKKLSKNSKTFHLENSFTLLRETNLKKRRTHTRANTRNEELHEREEGHEGMDEFYPEFERTIYDFIDLNLSEDFLKTKSLKLYLKEFSY